MHLIPDAKKQAALLLARDALSTLARLTEMTEVRGMSLTDNQTDDLRGAVDRYNMSARALMLATISSAPNTVELVRATRSLEQSYEGINPDAQAFINAMTGSGSGRAAASPAHGEDQIRSMLDARERQHDFTFPETEQIRSLPDPDDGSEVRAISDFANGTSLYVSDFASRVAMYARTESPWLALATVVTSSNGRPLVVPMLTGDVTVYTPGEGTAITPSDPTLTSVTVTPTGFKGLTYISRESFEDEDVNLTNVLARSHARAIGLAFGSASTTTVLAGINNGGTATGVGGNGTAVVAFAGYEDLIDLQLGRAAPYRASGAWVMANGMIKKVRKFKDGQGAYLWPTGDLPIGGRAYEDPYLAAPASATKSTVYGDFAAALIIKATPIRVELSSDFLFDKDQIAIKTVQRISLAVQDPAAAAYLVSAAT